MDYTQEIEANNAKIAELKAELAKLQGAPTMGTDAMDYALAANRAEYGDISGAQYHLNKPEERARMAKLYETYGNGSSDKETQYATLQDNVIEAEQELALTPKTNTALVAAGQRKLQNAKLRLAMFEKKNPNLIKMHWNWRGQAENGLGNVNTVEQAPAATIEGGNAKMGDLLETGPDGNVYLKDGADITPVTDYFKQIPYWWENEQIRKNLKYLNELKTNAQAAAAPTASNNTVWMLDESKYKNGLWNSAADRAEGKKRYEAMSDTEKMSKEGVAIKNALNHMTKQEYNEKMRKMDEEGWRKAGEVLTSLDLKLLKEQKIKEFVDKDGVKWTINTKGKLSHK